MKWLWTSLAVAIFSTVAIGQQIQLDGRLVTDAGEPVPNTKVRVAGEQAAVTDVQGRFSVHLSSKFGAGKSVVIVVEKKDWIINQPLDGEWTIPANSSQTVDVVIVPFGSKALWTSARIEKELVRSSQPADVEMLARKYGTTVQATKEAFDKWATNQNDTANALKEQAARVDVIEGARLLGEAVSAYRRALLVFTREDMPQEWATTQHNLANALQDQGTRAQGSESIRLFGQATAAYRQALTVRTREQLPRQWATTLNDLGNALQGQGTRAEGADARRLLGEAADAYNQALLFFTREYAPPEWAMTQHNLGSALHERGTRTDGPEGLRLLGDAVAAYRRALLVRTRDQMPQQWALTQNNLGNVLQAQGTRADKSEALGLLQASVAAYRQALLVFTREQRPQMWAMAKHNLGSALQEEGTRGDGPDAHRLLQEAATAYEEALLVWTRQQRPQQWAMAQNNLARAYFNLKEWVSAAQYYENVLEVFPDFRSAYEKARWLEHDVIFNYPRALKLSESWLQKNPNDAAAVVDLAESHFTNGSFDKYERRISAALFGRRLEAGAKISLLPIEMANLIALKRLAEIPVRIKNLIEVLETQPADFKLPRSFAGTKQFISRSQQLDMNKPWLLQLFAAMEGENRDEIIKELKAAAESFTPE